jgi:hypothetical protein
VFLSLGFRNSLRRVPTDCHNIGRRSSHRPSEREKKEKEKIKNIKREMQKAQIKDDGKKKKSQKRIKKKEKCGRSRLT